MFCKNCGTKIENINHRFCRNCGEELINQTIEKDYIDVVTVLNQEQNQNKNILSRSIDLLKINIYKNIHLVLLAILTFIVLSNIESIQNIPYIYIIFKIIQCMVISLITMKILLSSEEFKEVINYYNKSILIWIVNLIITCVVIEIIDRILITIGNSMLNNIDYYSQGVFIDKFNFSMLFIELVTVDIIVTITTYIFTFKILNIVKNNMQISLKQAFASFKNNITNIIKLLVISEGVGFLNGLLLGSDGLITNLISLTIVFIWIAVVTSIAYLNIESNY